MVADFTWVVHFEEAPGKLKLISKGYMPQTEAFRIPNILRIDFFAHFENSVSRKISVIPLGGEVSAYWQVTVNAIDGEQIRRFIVELKHPAAPTPSYMILDENGVSYLSYTKHI